MTSEMLHTNEQELPLSEKDGLIPDYSLNQALTIIEEAQIQKLAKTQLTPESPTIIVYGTMNDYVARYLPDNSGSAEQQKEMSVIQSQIDRISILQDRRGRNKFTDNRTLSRLEQKRTELANEISHVVFSLPKGKIPEMTPVETEQPFDKSPLPLIGQGPEKPARVAMAMAVTALSITPSTDIHPMKAETPTKYIELNQHQVIIELLNQLSISADQLPSQGGQIRAKLNGEDINIALTQEEVQLLKAASLAQEPPAAGDEGEYDSTSIYLPALQGGGLVEPGATPTNPSDRPTRTPRPTATRTPTAQPTAPEQTPTVPATSTPTETATPTPTATETPTPTEAGPLKELALKQGDPLIIAGDSPTLRYALLGKNGDEESGAAAAGYDFASMQSPVLDGSGKYVVGTVIKDGKELTIRVPAASLDPQTLERIQPGNPEEDERLGATVTLWAGRGGREKTLVANALGGGGLGSFIGNYDTGADFHVQASATGTAKNGIIEFSSYNPGTKRWKKFQLSSDLKGTWSIVNGEQDTETGTYPGPLTTLHTFAQGVSDLRFRIVGDQLYIPQGEGQESKQIFIPYRLTNGITYTGSDRKGSDKSQAFIRVQKADVRFLEVAPDEPIGGPEFAIPTFAEVAKQADIEIMTSSMRQPMPADHALRQNASTLYDAFDIWGGGYPTDEQAEYFDQDKPAAIILDVGMSDNDVLKIITENPNAIFQYGPEVTGRGPYGNVFNPDGTLSNKQQLRKIIAAARANGSEVLLNTNVRPDMTLARTGQAEQPNRLSPMIRALEDLKAIGAGREVTLLLAGDSEYIDTEGLDHNGAVEALRFALQTVQEAGIKAGLGNIIGPGDENIANDAGKGTSSQFYRLIGEAVVGLKGIRLGFNDNLTPLNYPQLRMGLIDKLPSGTNSEQTYKYTYGANNLRLIFAGNTLP